MRNRGRTGWDMTDSRAEEVCGGFMGRLLIRCCIIGYSSGRNGISSEGWYSSPTCISQCSRLSRQMFRFGGYQCKRYVAVWQKARTRRSVGASEVSPGSPGSPSKKLDML